MIVAPPRIAIRPPPRVRGARIGPIHPGRYVRITPACTGTTFTGTTFTTCGSTDYFPSRRTVLVGRLPEVAQNGPL
jgi:hypothetical protein